METRSQLSWGVRERPLPTYVMTSSEVTAVVERELANFRYESPATGLLGRPWSAERVAAGVARLRSALVPPRRVTLQVSGAEGAQRREAWTIAQAHGLEVLYDPAT